MKLMQQEYIYGYYSSTSTTDWHYEATSGQGNDRIKWRRSFQTAVLQFSRHVIQPEWQNEETVHHLSHIKWKKTNIRLQER